MLQLDMVPGACGAAVRTRDPGRVVLLCGPGTRGVWCCCADPGPGACGAAVWTRDPGRHRGGQVNVPSGGCCLFCLSVSDVASAHKKHFAL